MALLARLATGAALALLASSGCSDALFCTDATAERGRADTEVEVQGAGSGTGVTAAITEWRLEPNPQVPDEGDRVFFSYRFVSEDEPLRDAALDVCAVDADRVALACMTIDSRLGGLQDDGSITGEDWLAVERPEQVAGVLLVPNDQSYQRPDCDTDLKDGGGTHPPQPAGPGDRF